MASYNPKTYDGKPNPVEFEDWASMDKLFDAINCPEKWKVGFAVYYLVGQADLWWETVKERRNNEDFGWTQLKDLMRAKFYPSALKRQKEEEFNQLEQGNSYHASIDMAPYEAPYGRKCRTPLSWSDIDESKIIGPEMIQETSDKVRIIQEKMRTAQSRQKSYADLKRRHVELSVGESVFLKIFPTRGVVRFGKARKLRHRYIGTFEIIEKIVSVAYRLSLPSEFSRIHDVFHVSLLRRYIPDPSHIITILPVRVGEDLTYEEQPVQILDHKDKVLRNKVIPLVKVLWSNHIETEATWEVEQDMRDKYPHLF
ncbi:uncharacterized protein LOC130589906 [Beta vulgaris subsp. vulgaris]|uniref:uncharacterized protein LOC130589906 n=1 Tax=Beta vulgaris subsp. vulgaris TaxID=3555 RepID=UPI00254700D1|nr:uncharacterized protein LOC130589906 [Beta vulgaris subsp. vulgaris]